MTSIDLRPALEQIPLYPPGEWFSEMPSWFSEGDKLSFRTEGPDAGRVAATVAPRDQCILDGTDNCWTAPYSPTNYAAAHQGDTLTAEGSTIHTANIGGGVNHAREALDFRGAVRHYENIATQMMRVRYHDLDGHIIALGALWPDVTEQQLAVLRASALSGDWRYRRELGAFDMAGAQLVSNPGFPLIRRVQRAGAEDVYVGGMGGVGAFDLADPIADEMLDACPQCAALTSRVADLEAILAGLKISENIGDVATMLESAMASLGSLPKVLARVAALEESQERIADMESSVGQLVDAVGSRPRRIVFKRDADRLVTEAVEE